MTPGDVPGAGGSSRRQPARFVVRLEAVCAPDEALRRVLDLRAHDRLVPLTRVTPAVPADELDVGSRFVGRTALGPVGFEDVMRIEQLTFAPEPQAVIVKEGRLLRGRVRVTATPSTRGSLVTWEQEVVLPWLPRPLHRVAATVMQAGYRRVLAALLEE